VTTWIVSGLLLSVGAGLLSACNFDETTSRAAPTYQVTELGQPADIEVLTPPERAEATRVDPGCIGQVGIRFLRLVIINSLLTTHLPIHLE
jgi:hypothetical protein